MTAIPLPLVDGDTLFIDNSSLEYFTTCPRSAEYALCRRRRGAGSASALTFGGIIHKILESRYRSAAPMYAQSPEVESVMRAIADTEFARWSPPEDDHRNYSCATSFIREYGLAYPFESFDIIKFPDGRPFIEVPFAVPLGIVGTPPIKIIWTGRIDMAYTSNNSTYILDHKTTSVMGPSYFAQFEIAHQLYGYAWAAEQVLGQQITGAVINALGIRRPTKSGRAFEFERRLFPIQRGLLADWKIDTLHIVSDFVHMCQRGYMPKHTAWCVGKFGECQFRKVCTLDSAPQRDIMLSSGEFMDNTWSPLT